jgi:hypothetical protein
MHLQQIIEPSTCIICYTDASLAPDFPVQNLQEASSGIMFVNIQVHPSNTLYIKAIMKDVSLVMAEPGALAVATRIANNMRYTQISFLTNNSQLVHFLSSSDYSHPLDWRMKTYTQVYDTCSDFTHPHLYKISRSENLATNYLARETR